MRQSPAISSLARMLLVTLLLFGIGPRLRAQTAARALTAGKLDAPDYRASARMSAPPKRLAPLRATDTAAGSRVTLASDASLDDYSTRLDGERFDVLIPHAETLAPAGEIDGRGFDGVRVESRQGGVLLSFRLQPGARARVTQKFNRLHIDFTTRADGVAPGDPARPQEAATQPQTEAGGDTGAQLRQLLKRIEELEGRVKELQARADDEMPTPQTMPANVAAGEPTAESVEQEQAATSGHDEHEAGSGPRLKIQGFADVNLRASNRPGATTSFNLGQLDLFITSRLSDKFSVISELILEAKPDNSFEFEIHRLLLRYAHSDYFNLSVGRNHTGIGFYNTAYHHGSFFATAANRPFLFAFEGQGGPLPLHNVGLSATGRLPSGRLGLRYVAEVGNGRAARSPADRTVQTAFDENNGKAFNLGLLARPDRLPGLQTGFSFYRDRVTPANSPAVDQSIMAGHVVYQSPNYEWLNEAVIIRNSPRGAAAVVSYTPGFYTQFARRFGKAQPYARYQYINAPGRDPMVRNIGRRNGPSLGLRYELTDYAAFKTQYDHTGRRGLKSIDELIMQLAFTF